MSRSSPLPLRQVVEERACVARAVGAEPGYFGGETVVAYATDWSSDNCDAYYPIFMDCAEAELSALNWLVMPMMLEDEGVGLAER